MSDISFYEMLTKLANIENKVLTESLSEAPEEAKETEVIKTVVPFNQLAELLFTDENMEVGKTALRKVLRKSNLTIRERAILSDALAGIIPIIANDRTIFNRILRLKV